MVKHKKTFKKGRKSLKSYDRKIKKSFNKNHCSPKKSKNTLSCIDHDILLKIAHIFNKFYNANIDLNDKKKLYKQISEKISSMSDCKSESCWVTLNEIIRHLTSDELNRFKNSFRPQMPRSWLKNKNEWASTSDIEKVLKQYEEHHNDFKCYGALPMDFDLKQGNSCLSGNLCNIDLLFFKFISFLNAFKFFINKSIALEILYLLLKKISRHIISFDAAILEKSLNPPALYFIKP